MSSFTIPIILLLTGSTIWWLLYIYRRKVHHNLPPGPRPLPIIGNLHMLGNLPHRTLTKLSKKYGPIMSIRFGLTQAIIVSSPKEAELFLKTHDAVFANRPPYRTFNIFSYGSKGIAFTPYSQYWRHMRKFFTSELLSAAKINSLVDIRKEEVGLLVEEIKKAALAGEIVDVSEKVAKVIEDLTYRMVFGRNTIEVNELKSVMREAVLNLGTIDLADYLPFLAPLDLQGLNRRLKPILKKVDKLLETIIDYREKDKDQADKKDVIDEMLSLLNKFSRTNSQQSYTFDRSNIKAIVVDIIIAAIDTTTSTIQWILSELIRNPHVLKKLQEELNTIVGVDRMVEETDLAKLKYLDMVIKESFRLHPVAPLLITHESVDDIVINGYFIPKKSHIQVNAWAIGQDPQVWSNNYEEFLPERFIGNNIDVRGHDFQLIPFGSGRRGCPGQNLGLVNTQMVVAQLAHCFDWELPNGMSHRDLDMSEKLGFTLQRVNHLMALPIYRL